MRDQTSIINNPRVQSITISSEALYKTWDEARGEVPTRPSQESRKIPIADFTLQSTYCYKSYGKSNLCLEGSVIKIYLGHSGSMTLASLLK